MRWASLLYESLSNECGIVVLSCCLVSSFSPSQASTEIETTAAKPKETIDLSSYRFR
jgi:hypothetical protein